MVHGERHGCARQPDQSTRSETTTKELKAAARSLGLETDVLTARNEREIDAFFANLMLAIRRLAGSCSTPIIRHKPTNKSSSWHSTTHPCDLPLAQFVEAGGLLSYGADLYDSSR